MNLQTVFKSALVPVLFLVGGFAISAQAEGFRNEAVYNLQDQVGLKGFDPVAVFEEGGGSPQQGLAEFKLEYKGVIYFFASSENREIFSTNPTKYEPTYGGFCAWGMAHDARIDILPQFYTIQGNRAHYFVSGRAKRSFDANVGKYEALADGFWKNFSGEDPRL